MRGRFLANYTKQNMLFAFRVFYGDKYNLDGKRRAKKKIKSIKYWLIKYYSKKNNDKPFYWEQARECYEQLQEELNNI